MDAEDRTSAEPETSFAETALRLGGKSDDEARRTGAIDLAGRSGRSAVRAPIPNGQ